MADPEHLQILKQGVEAWNAWRCTSRNFIVNLVQTDLTAANLYRANLAGAYLAGVNLSGADLREADLTRGILIGADLSGADLRKAGLAKADLTWADLTGADVAGVRLYETGFSDTNLTAVRGLETCLHWGPSTLDHGPACAFEQKVTVST